MKKILDQPLWRRGLLAALLLALAAILAWPLTPTALAAPPDCNAASWAVATTTELNEAIACFNGKTVAGSYTITVTQNISLTTQIANIDNPTTGASLAIAGGNHTIDGGDNPGITVGHKGFNIVSNTAVDMADLTVTRCRSLLSGGGIHHVGGGPLTLNNVTLTYNGAGFGGGALTSLGPITITNSLIAHNVNGLSAGGGGLHIQTSGSMTLINSEVSDNRSAVIGGGIYAEAGASLTIEHSTIARNTASTNGGGITNKGALTMTHSTLSGNTATGDGGGLHAVEGGSNVLKNSTISGNSADNGGGIFTYDAVDLDSVTIAVNSVTGDGSGLYAALMSAPEEVNFRNTILADNSGSADCYGDLNAIIGDTGHNLIESQSSCGFTNGTDGNIVGVDPKLGPLADNGGPTQTHLPLTGSPVIDAGDTTLTVDQRGLARPIGAADDMGAAETTCAAASWTAATETELNTAIACFNGKTTPNTYVITVTDNIDLAASTTTINNTRDRVKLLIEGDTYAVSASGTNIRPFHVAAGTTVTMHQLNVYDGHVTSGNGGGILNEGTLTLNQCFVEGNRATAGSGGGIYSSGVLTVTNSGISDNTAGGKGGGIADYGTVTTLERSTLANNTAGSNGGGLYYEKTGTQGNATNQSLRLVNATVAGNSAAGGGGLHVLNGVGVGFTTFVVNM